MKLKKNFDIIVVGSGLSSLAFVNTLLDKKKSIHVISPKNKNRRNADINKHVYKFLPPQMIKEKNKVNNYFIYNKLEVDKNCKVFGSLEFGGLSNYWALQIDQNFDKDLSHLSKKVKQDISKSFQELFLKKKNNNFISSKNFKKMKFLQLFKNDKKIAIDYPILGFFNKKNKDLNFENLNEKKDKLVPSNFYNNYLKKKKYSFMIFQLIKLLKKKE